MRRLAIISALGLVGAGLLAPAAPAQAANVQYSFAATSGGTYVKVLDGTVNSDLTAQSFVSGGEDSAFAKNSTARAELDGLLEVGAVETRARATVEPAKTTVKSFARTANVNLLNGLITIDAVRTEIATVGRADGTNTSRGGTEFADIHIVGVDLPLNIPKNYQVTIPGIATVSLNHHKTYVSGPNIATRAWALGVTLIKPRAGYAAGVTLIVNPVNQGLAEAVPSVGAELSGGAYGTRVQADVGDRIRVFSDRTASVTTPVGSSGGKTVRNQTLGVNVPGLLTTGAVTSTSRSTKDGQGNAEIRNVNQTVGLNILGGLIKADAIRVVAYGAMQDGRWTSRMRMTTVNLVIAGQQIPVNVGRNTVIDVAGLGSVALNLQAKNPHGASQNAIWGIRITLDTERAGLPIGAVIEVAVATTTIG